VFTHRDICIRSDIVYIAAWILFFFMLYKASGIDAPVEEVWDPYGILGLETGATDKQIKSAYRKLSVQLHPDKNPGNESAHEIYLQVVKAHQTYANSNCTEPYVLAARKRLRALCCMEIGSFIHGAICT
jgi:translocation protein SEC63